MKTIMDVKQLSEEYRQRILQAKDELTIMGTRYYVANDGCDEGDGLTPQTAWRTLERANQAKFQPGDALLLRRGDVFRGQIIAQEGVTYAAYGQGEKPRVYAGPRDLADPALWGLVDPSHAIWKCAMPMLDAGTLVFNHGERHSRKLIPSYLGGRFVCRDHPETPFDMADEMTQDLDLFCHFDRVLTTQPSRGETFPIPDVRGDCYGDLYLRCDLGNPGEVFTSIESLARRHLIKVGEANGVRIDNLCLKYTGEHAIAACGPCVRGLHVTNCEIGWIGGSIQHYFGTDPNYPEGGRGTVTRYGNGVEIYGGCEDYLVENCYIYQAYDAGITHQISCFGKPYRMENVKYLRNLVENCVYSIEYFLETTPDDTESRMEDIEMAHNVLRLSGYGWGQQRHNTHTPAHIKGWSYVNTASNYRIHHNVLDRAAYRMIHLVAHKQESLPHMHHNTYVQHQGGLLGQYGANEVSEPPILPFDEASLETLHEDGLHLFVVPYCQNTKSCVK